MDGDMEKPQTLATQQDKSAVFSIVYRRLTGSKTPID